jgi:hypothetical protein
MNPSAEQREPYICILNIRRVEGKTVNRIESAESKSYLGKNEVFGYVHHNQQLQGRSVACFNSQSYLNFRLNNMEIVAQINACTVTQVR